MQLGLGANIVMDLNTMEQYPAMLGALRMLKKQIVLKCIVFSYIMEGNGYVTYAEGQVAMIEAGGHHCIALTRDGKVFTWGARVYIEPAEREEFNDLPDGEHATYVRVVYFVSGSMPVSYIYIFLINEYAGIVADR